MDFFVYDQDRKPWVIRDSGRFGCQIRKYADCPCGNADPGSGHQVTRVDIGIRKFFCTKNQDGNELPIPFFYTRQDHGEMSIVVVRDIFQLPNGGWRPSLDRVKMVPMTEEEVSLEMEREKCRSLPNC